MFGLNSGINSRGGFSISAGPVTYDTKTGNVGFKMSDHLAVDKDGIHVIF